MYDLVPNPDTQLRISRGTVTSHTILMTLGPPKSYYLRPRDAQVVGMNGLVLWNFLPSCFGLASAAVVRG